MAATMRRVRSKDTSPELAPRPYCKQLPGQPDLMFSPARLVVLVDGDFRHGQQWQLRGLRSLEDQIKESSSASCWVRKIGRNIERDVVTKHFQRRVAEDSLKGQKVADEPETVNACSEAIEPEG